jgi:hypothetical protein
VLIVIIVSRHLRRIEVAFMDLDTEKVRLIAVFFIVFDGRF